MLCRAALVSGHMEPIPATWLFVCRFPSIPEASWYLQTTEICVKNRLWIHGLKITGICQSNTTSLGDEGDFPLQNILRYKHLYNCGWCPLMKTDWRLQASHSRVGGKKRRLICNFPRENTHHLKKKSSVAYLKIIIIGKKSTPLITVVILQYFRSICGSPGDKVDLFWPPWR